MFFLVVIINAVGIFFHSVNYLCFDNGVLFSLGSKVADESAVLSSCCLVGHFTPGRTIVCFKIIKSQSLTFK